MALCLPCTITLLHPYDGHILGIFLDTHVIYLLQYECATAQQWAHNPGSPLRPDRRRPRGPLLNPRHDTCVALSSHVLVFRTEDKRRQTSSSFALGVGFGVH